MELTTEQKAKLIIETMVSILKDHRYIQFESDLWGGNTLVIEIENKGHSHCGQPDGDLDKLIDELYLLLCKNIGMEFI